MKAKILALSFFVLGTGASMAQESDDLYFFTSDRAKLNEATAMDLPVQDTPSAAPQFTAPASESTVNTGGTTIVNNYYGAASSWRNSVALQGGGWGFTPVYFAPVSRFGYNRVNVGVSWGSAGFYDPYYSGTYVTNINTFSVGRPVFFNSFGPRGGFYGGGGFANINTFGVGGGVGSNYYCPPTNYGGGGVVAVRPSAPTTERPRGTRGGGNTVVYAPSVTREGRAGRQVGTYGGSAATRTRNSSATAGSRTRSTSSSGRSYTPRTSTNSPRTYTPSRSRSTSTPSRTRTYTPSRSRSSSSGSYRSSSPSRSRSSSTRSSSSGGSRSSGSRSSSGGGSRSRGGRGN